MRKKTMMLLPLGTRTEEAWRMVNDVAPDAADALAVAAFRYALTGESADGPGAPPNAWKKAKAEIDLLLARREAGREGGRAKALANGVANDLANGVANGVANAYHPSSVLHSSEEKGKREKPKSEDEEASSVLISSISSAMKSSASPAVAFETWAATQEDPVAVALKAADEGDSARPVYGALLRDIRKGAKDGSRLFVAEVCRFFAEVAAGEAVRNKGAALVRRLSALRDGLRQTLAPARAPVAVEAAAPVEAAHDADALQSAVAGIVGGLAPKIDAKPLPPLGECTVREFLAANCPGYSAEQRQIWQSFADEQETRLNWPMTVALDNSDLKKRLARATGDQNNEPHT